MSSTGFSPAKKRRRARQASRKLAADGVTVYKFRGDEEREYVGAKMNTASFPTVNKLVGGKFVKYDSEDRTVSALKAFAK